MIIKNTPASESELELLNLISEEAAEVIQIISKIQRFGFDSHHPQDDGKVVNRSRLESELGDLLCVISLIIEKKIVSGDVILEASDKKLEKLKKYSNVFEVLIHKEPQKIINELELELDAVNQFINTAFSVYPNLDQDVIKYRESE